MSDDEVVASDVPPRYLCFTFSHPNSSFRLFVRDVINSEWTIIQPPMVLSSFSALLGCELTSTAGVHQMRLLRRHSFIIIIIIIVVVGHLKSFQPQKPPFSLFENNSGQTDRRTNQPTDGHDLLSNRDARTHLKTERGEESTNTRV